MRHLISLDDLTDEDLRAIVARAARLADDPRQAATSLAGEVVGIYFSKTSTRTRTAFSSGALRLGARIISYGPGDLQINTGETIEDTGRVLSTMLDALVVRTAGDPAELRAMADQKRMSVVNAMTADEHPTQALADLTTMVRRFGRVDGLRVLYLGEGNNSAAALALALTRFPGTELHLRTPPGYGLDPEVLARGQAHAARHGASLVERHDMTDLPTADVVYTTRWETTGTTKPDPDWRTVFAPFQVTREIWRTSPDAVFMHDLPAHRGEEVTAEVLDGQDSIAFAQAENKMYSAMAVLEWCRGRDVA
ncbi:ornithine carbamoyltransferase [Actinophytocola sp. NPDC049390]|uniref:ornithine carbamoyltransferase n=1 Tax=Actinophytocola sp. NPDC049390 TaxID=3363894 RepID=UPI0037935634